MFKKIVDQTKIEDPISGFDFKYVAHCKSRARKKSTGITDIFRAKIEASVFQELRNTVSIEKSVVVRGTAGWFQDRNAFLRRFLLKPLVPELAEHLQSFLI